MIEKETSTNHSTETETTNNAENKDYELVAYKNILESIDFSLEKNNPPIEAIRNLEEAGFNFIEKLPMLLAALGEKPSSLACVSHEIHENDQISRAMFEQESREIIEAADKLGLFVHAKNDVILDNFFTDSKTKVRTFCMSLSKENLNVLEKAVTPGGTGDEVDELILGKVLGFPDTAIAAFVANKDLIPVNDIPNNSPGLPFAQFRMSYGNFKDELSTAKHWGDAIKTSSPAIYKEYTDIWNQNFLE